eukprot:8114655-Pyramimonas_sp.AAC.1
MVSVRNDFEACIRNMKRNKACAEDGIIVEMLKDSGSDMVDVITDVFCKLLNGDAKSPAEWRTSKIVVLFKKGDAALPNNYRPRAIIPVLCKLYSSVLLRRINSLLEAARAPEDMGFQKGYRCEDL